MRTVGKFLSTMLVLIVIGTGWASAQGASPDTPSDFYKLVGAGGQSLAFVVAMYWLKDSNERRVKDVSDINERRVEDANRHATEIREIKTIHKEELKKVVADQSREISEIHAVNKSMMERLFTLATPGK